jgi:L-alanine-DL-glutamate epimerase-like enolase superfamily enzyme
LLNRGGDRAVSAPLGDERLIASVTLRRLKLPLNRPYRLSYRTFEEFEPIIAEVVLDDGRVGWGEGHISPGSSKETREGGWAFACATAEQLVGELAARAYELVQTSAVASPVAATALACAIEMAAGHPALVIDEPIDLPLLAPINASDAPDIELEVSDLLGRGFRTFKVKVGKSVPDDLARVRGHSDPETHVLLKTGGDLNSNTVPPPASIPISGAVHTRAFACAYEPRRLKLN